MASLIKYAGHERRGRPPLSANRQKSVNVTFRATLEQDKAIKQAAKLLGITPSTYLRLKLFG